MTTLRIYHVSTINKQSSKDRSRKVIAVWRLPITMVSEGRHFQAVQKARNFMMSLIDNTMFMFLVCGRVYQALFACRFGYCLLYMSLSLLGLV